MQGSDSIFEDSGGLSRVPDTRYEVRSQMKQQLKEQLEKFGLGDYGDQVERLKHKYF